jgi:phosphoribosylanthranilate isomerase
MTKVKICGITTLEDALMSAEAGADMLGLNFYKKSPRYIDLAAAKALCDGLRKQLGSQCPVLVGVFVNSPVSDISVIVTKAGLNFAQLSGDESADMLIDLYGIGFKSVQPMNEAMALDDVNYFREAFPVNENAPSLLLDAYHPTLRGGTGMTASIEIATAVKVAVPRLMLAGGLTPDNVAGIVQAVEPWGVDVASGVESGTPGVKDAAKVKAFIEAAKGVRA